MVTIVPHERLQAGIIITEFPKPIGELESPETGPFATTRGWGSLFELEFSRSDTYRFVRGPPAA